MNEKTVLTELALAAEFIELMREPLKQIGYSIEDGRLTQTLATETIVPKRRSSPFR